MIPLPETSMSHCKHLCIGLYGNVFSSPFDKCTGVALLNYTMSVFDLIKTANPLPRGARPPRLPSSNVGKSQLSRNPSTLDIVDF